MGVKLSIEITEGKDLAKRFADSGNVKGPLENGIKKLTLKVEREAKKATVVDTGRLRASISHRFSGTSAAVGTNVQYAEWVEWGTDKSNPPNEGRHMEGASKVFGLGMLGYAIEATKEWAKERGGDIAKEIANRLCLKR